MRYSLSWNASTNQQDSSGILTLEFDNKICNVRLDSSDFMWELKSFLDDIIDSTQEETLEFYRTKSLHVFETR